MKKTKMILMLESELNKGKISQTELAEEFKMSPTQFSQWKSGLRLPPDPRDEEGLKRYTLLAKYFNITQADAILYSLLTDIPSTPNISPFMKGFNKRANERMQEVVLRPGIERIIWNIKGCEYFLDLLEKMLKEYIALTKKDWRWIENKTQVKEEHKKRDQLK